MDFFRGENFASECKINLFLKYNISSDLKSVVLNQIGHTKYQRLRTPMVLVFFAVCVSIQPNILFLAIDDLGFNDMGFSQKVNGQIPVVTQTPTSDTLATSGIIFTNM
jgi:hypothetical protein